jgi:hypothetical protein
MCTQTAAHHGWAHAPAGVLCCVCVHIVATHTFAVVLWSHTAPSHGQVLMARQDKGVNEIDVGESTSTGGVC